MRIVDLDRTPEGEVVSDSEQEMAEPIRKKRTTMERIAQPRLPLDASPDPGDMLAFYLKKDKKDQKDFYLAKVGACLKEHFKTTWKSKGVKLLKKHFKLKVDLDLLRLYKEYSVIPDGYMLKYDNDKLKDVATRHSFANHDARIDLVIEEANESNYEWQRFQNHVEESCEAAAIDYFYFRKENKPKTLEDPIVEHFDAAFDQVAKIMERLQFEEQDIYRKRLNDMEARHPAAKKKELEHDIVRSVREQGQRQGKDRVTTKKV